MLGDEFYYLRNLVLHVYYIIHKSERNRHNLVTNKGTG
jgi:hypothetical protein